MSMTTPRVTVPVEPTALSVCRAIAPYLGATDLNDWSGLEDDDAISMPVKMRVGDLRDLKAVISAAPAPEGGAATFDRDALIALIMEETTDDIVADGWDRLGKPNVLVQGCRYIRRNAPPSPEGYANPEAAAKQFAGFIADRLLAAREEAPAEAGEDVNWKAEYEAACAARISDRQKSQEVINERDKWVAELLQERAALRAQPPARSGKVTWHSSGEDEGPDVGMQLDLGHGRSLWLGEGQKPTGWQFSLVHGDDIIPVADVIDHDQARDLFDLIASAVQPPAREDAQPFMFAYEDVDKPGDWRAFRHQIRRTDGSICPGRALYTHPAPDALRVAVEALETTRNRINTWPIDDHETCMCGSTIEAHDIGSGHFPVSQADHAVSTIVAEINKALSALQAEQKGGA